MTRPARDERDPLPREPWRPTSSEWARRAAKEATKQAVDRAKSKRTSRTAHTEETKP